MVSSHSDENLLARPSATRIKRYEWEGNSVSDEEMP